MRGRSIVVFAAAMVLAAGSTGVRAEDGKKDDGFARRLFTHDIDPQKKSYACFVRRYDAAHLKAHPLQKVSVMRLLITAERVPEDQALNYSFRLGVNFRDRPGNFDSSGDCGHGMMEQTADNKAHLGCGVDCDGGGITVELAPSNKFTLVRLDSIRIWRNNKPEEEGFSLSGGADDKVFHLDRVSLDDCRSLVTDRKELAAMRRK